MIRLKSILAFKYLYILLVLIALVYALIYLNIPRNSVLNINNNCFIGYISKMNISGNRVSLEVFNKEKIIGTYYFDSKEEKELFKRTYHLGDKVRLLGTYTVPSNNTLPNLFNYKKYLYRRNIFYLFQIDSIKILEKNNNIFYTIKGNIINRINSYKSNDYLYTFILGDTSNIDIDIKTTYQTNGISHLLAISGMHVSLLSGMLLWFLNKIGMSNIFKFVLVSVFLLFYMILLGATSSVSRAVVLFIILGINKRFKLNIKTINVCLLTLAVLIFMNPNSLFDVGFQFSFIVSFSLILGNKLLKGRNYIIKLFKASLLSFVVSIPISLYYFYQINILSIFYNLIFVPLVTLFVFPLALITFIIPVLDNIFFVVTDIMENISIFIDGITFSKLIFMKPSIIWIIMYYGLFSFYIYIGNKLIVGFMFILILYLYFNPVLFSKDYLIMLDVGQGDSLLVHSSNKTVLIDTGGRLMLPKEEWEIVNSKSLSDNTVIPLLKSLGIRKIDYLILTHGDYDHMGEGINLVNKFKINKVIFNNGTFKDLELQLLDVLKRKNIKYSNGIDSIKLGSGIMYFLNTKLYDNENDNSNVVYFIYRELKFLFMGDAGKLKEKDIVDKYNLTDIDFLKIGHHGSDTSNSKYFIDIVKPKYSLISVGKNNRYNHPKESVLDNLKNSTIYRTDKDGSIEIKLNKNGYKVNTCPP